MSLVSRLARILALRRSSEPRDPDERRIPFTWRTPAGVIVNADLALKSNVVWACVRYLSQTVAGLPWHVMEDRGGGRVERARNSRIDWLLSGEPSPEWTPFQLKETLMRWALIWGNGYAEIERDTVGRPIALWPIHPERVEVERDPQTRDLVYEVNNGTDGRVIIPREDMFHLRGMGDGPVGLSVIEYAAQTIGWAQATELFGATFFGSGASPSGVVKVTGKVSPEAFNELRKEISKRTRPTEPRIWAFDDKMEYHQLSIDPDKSQFIETMQFQVEAICRWFGVPPHKVMHLLRSTFSNIEHQSIEVVVDSVLPWVKRLEEEANAKLFGVGRRGFAYTKMNLNALMRGDSQSRAEFYQTMRNVGALSANDIRRLEDLNEIGPKGDVYVMQGQYLPLEVIAEQTAPSTAVPMGPAPEPAGPEDGDEASAMAEIEALARMLEPLHANG